MENNVKYSGVACYNVNVELGRSILSDKTGVLVLETNHQPDYYTRFNFPPNKHQSSWRLFLLVKKHIDCFQDVVLKKAYLINKKQNTDMEIMPGYIDYSNKKYQCIRINISDKELLGGVINDLEKEGIVFLKDKKTNPYKTSVFFKRYTELIEMKEGVYMDSKIPGHYFFPIDKIIEFDEFEVGVEKIKNGCDFHMFDSFLSFMFIDGGKGQDFIGIFSNHCDEDRFPELKINIKKTFE